MGVMGEGWRGGGEGFGAKTGGGDVGFGSNGNKRKGKQSGGGAGEGEGSEGGGSAAKMRKTMAASGGRAKGKGKATAGAEEDTKPLFWSDTDSCSESDEKVFETLDESQSPTVAAVAAAAQPANRKAGVKVEEAGAKEAAKRKQVRLADAEFALGRFVFLVPRKSKRSDRPILVGKVVDKMPDDDEEPVLGVRGAGGGGSSSSRSSSPRQPPTIPASSTTSLLLRKAAALVEGLASSPSLPPQLNPAGAATLPSDGAGAAAGAAAGAGAGAGSGAGAGAAAATVAAAAVSSRSTEVEDAAPAAAVAATTGSALPFGSSADGGSGVGVDASSPKRRVDKGRWVYVHWHTPASLRRVNYCRCGVVHPLPSFSVPHDFWAVVCRVDFATVSSLYTYDVLC